MVPYFSSRTRSQPYYPSYYNTYSYQAQAPVNYSRGNGGNYNFTYAKLDHDGYGVSRVVTYAEYQSSDNNSGYGNRKVVNYQENLDFSLDYDEGDERKEYCRSKIVPYRKGNDKQKWHTNRYPTRNYHDRYLKGSNSYPLQIRDSQRRNYSRSLPIKCYTCGRGFPNKTEMFTHKDEAHSKRNYYCPSCDKQFSVLKHMKEHEKTHTIQACPMCPEIFKFKDSLIAHKKHAHPPPPTTEEPAKSDPTIDKSGFKTFTSPVAASTPAPSFSGTSQEMGSLVKVEAHACPHCVKSFDSEEKLRSHSKVHTDPTSKSQATHLESQASHSESQSSDKLKCPFCVKQFLARRELTLHLDSAHTRVYYCRKCPAEYSTQIELDAHAKVHI